MQEEILIKKHVTGTTVHYFNTDINEYNFDITTIPAILKLDSTDNVPLELHGYDGVFLTGNPQTVLWKRNTEQNSHSPEVKMNFVYDNLGGAGNFLATGNSAWPNPNYISGRTFSETLNISIDDLRKDSVTNKFTNYMNSLFTAGTTTFVFFEPVLIEDFYANIKLEKTYDVLNTLSIYNKVSGEYPIRESATGVVFGKLEAIQKITDTNGNKIRIPLRNVPIGIFTTSDDFQTPTDLDENGNRIRLNYRPLTETKESYPSNYKTSYFNEESASFDNLFLTKAPLSGLDIHPTFKNVVYTNENGEFFLHNIEVGPQILFFEVDLLKQGLTKDEVALNFFPYPPNYDNISIDTIPHYFYRAIPIDVVPSWGISYQTGYTEVNVSANLDLRKWATYIIPPVTHSNNKTDSVTYQNYSKAPLTVQVRDMSKFNKEKLKEINKKEKLEVYPSKGIQMVEIQNVVDKNSGQQWEWANEFSQIKDRALFYSYGFHALKLPANIYDEQGFKTDINGGPKTGTTEERRFSKGVWLCGYQLKVFLTDEKSLYRTTGMQVGWDTTTTKRWFTRDHFHCSLYGDENLVTIYNFQGLNSSYDTALASGLSGETGTPRFPYEKAWTKNYPEPYNIPKKPTIPNFVDANGGFDPYGIIRPYMETPLWKDGDFIPGNSYVGFGGAGLNWNSEEIQYTDFATDIVGNSDNAGMYRYEPTATGDGGCYLNGYCYEFDNANNGVGVGKTSRVEKAERYQRIEAGYGYFLFPNSLPRIIAYPWYYDGYHILESDYELHNAQNKAISYPSDLSLSVAYANVYKHHYHSFSVQNNGKSVAMDLYQKKQGADRVGIINDNLNIYRIISGADRLPYSTKQKSIPTSTKLSFGGFGDGYYSLFIKNVGENSVKITNTFHSDASNTHLGIDKSKIYINLKNPTGDTIAIYPNETFILDVDGQIDVPYIQENVTQNVYNLWPPPVPPPPGENNPDYPFDPATQTIEIIGITGSTCEIKVTTKIYASDIIKFSSLIFPGNADYDEINNWNSMCKYIIGISVNDPISNDTSSPFHSKLGSNEPFETLTLSYPGDNFGHVDIQWYVDARPLSSQQSWYINTENTGNNCSDSPCQGTTRFGITTFNVKDNPAYYRVYASQTMACDVSNPLNQVSC